MVTSWKLEKVCQDCYSGIQKSRVKVIGPSDVQLIFLGDSLTGGVYSFNFVDELWKKEPPFGFRKWKFVNIRSEV